MSSPTSLTIWPPVMSTSPFARVVAVAPSSEPPSGAAGSGPGSPEPPQATRRRTTSRPERSDADRAGNSLPQLMRRGCLRAPLPGVVGLARGWGSLAAHSRCVNGLITQGELTTAGARGVDLLSRRLREREAAPRRLPGALRVNGSTSTRRATRSTRTRPASFAPRWAGDGLAFRRPTMSTRDAFLEVHERAHLRRRRPTTGYPSTHMTECQSTWAHESLAIVRSVCATSSQRADARRNEA